MSDFPLKFHCSRCRMFCGMIHADGSFPAPPPCEEITCPAVNALAVGRHRATVEFAARFEGVDFSVIKKVLPPDGKFLVRVNGISLADAGGPCCAPDAIPLDMSGVTAGIGPQPGMQN